MASPDGHSFSLRFGGTLTISPDELVVDRTRSNADEDADPALRIDPDQVVEVTLDSIDYFLLVLSLAIVGFGVLSLERNLFAGLAFAVLGLASCYRTYRRRDALRIRVTGRAKPVVVYPDDSSAVAAALEAHVAAETA